MPWCWFPSYGFGSAGAGMGALFIFFLLLGFFVMLVISPVVVVLFHVLGSLFGSVTSRHPGRQLPPELERELEVMEKSVIKHSTVAWRLEADDRPGLAGVCLEQELQPGVTMKQAKAVMKKVREIRGAYYDAHFNDAPAATPAYDVTTLDCEGESITLNTKRGKVCLPPRQEDALLILPEDFHYDVNGNRIKVSSNPSRKETLLGALVLIVLITPPLCFIIEIAMIMPGYFWWFVLGTAVLCSFKVN